MGQVKAPDVPHPKRGLTDFERKIADILFAETSTNELQVERVLDMAIAIGEGLLRDARERKVRVNGMGERYLVMESTPVVNDNTLNEGDKVKLIIVKEDKDTKFHVGDRIRKINCKEFDRDMSVERVCKDYYLCNNIGKFSSTTIPFAEEDDYELIKED